MSQRSTGRILLQRWWLALVTVVALGLGVACMWKVHQFSEPKPVISVNGPQAPEEFNPKHLTYEVRVRSVAAECWSTSTSTGIHTRSTSKALPWSHTETTVLTVVSGSISAHVHGGQVDLPDAGGWRCARPTIDHSQTPMSSAG